MSMKDFIEGAKVVGDVAGKKFTGLAGRIGDVGETITRCQEVQTRINNDLIEGHDEHEDRLQALEDNRYFVRMSRHSLDDMKFVEQERLAAWLQKLMLELNDRGFAPSENQQAFLRNLFKSMGLQDEFMQIDGLGMLENFGDNGMHEAIYKIFLVLCYLHNNSFSILTQLDDVERMFKLNDSDRATIRNILENERIPTLGIPGLVDMFNPEKPLNSFTVASLVSRHIGISSHTLLNKGLSRKECATYLKGFALVAGKDGKLTEEQHSYLSNLAGLFGCPECVYEVDQLCASPQTVDVKGWQELFDTDEKKYAWALDAAVLLALDDGFDIEKDNSLEQVLRGIKLPGAQDFIAAAVKMVRTDNPTELLEIVKQLSRNCKDWKHVLEFQGIGFQGAFSDIIAKLKEYWSDAISLGFELNNISWDNLKNIMTGGDVSDAPSFLWKVAIKAGNKLAESGRSGSLKNLADFKKKLEALVENYSGTFGEANAILSTFGIERITFDDWALRMKDFELDNAASNENWADDFQHLVDFLQKNIDESIKVSELLVEQLQLFEQGKLNESILTVKERESAAKKEQERLEREARVSVKIDTDSGAQEVSITWKDITDLPFDPASIASIASDGKNWMLLADYIPYFSEDGEKWSSLKEHIYDGNPYDSRVKHVNGTWILSGDSKLFFSQDGYNWGSSPYPKTSTIYAPEIYFFDGQWLLFVQDHKHYTYKEKGLIFDSEETGIYSAPMFYRSSSLDGPWELWKEASNPGEGIEKRCRLFGVNEKLIVASFVLDWLYVSKKKKPSNEAQVAYITPSGRWKQATWPEGKSYNGVFYFWGTKGVCLVDNAILTSSNGYEWKVAVSNISTGDTFLEVDGPFLISPNSKGSVQISGDGVTFNELVLSDVGTWQNFASSGKELLAVFRPSEHEAFLRKGSVRAVQCSNK